MKLFFYGLGKDGKLFFEKYFNRNVIPFGFVDRNKELVRYAGIQVITPEELLKYSEKCLVVISTSKYYEEISSYLKDNPFIIPISMDYMDYLFENNLLIEFLDERLDQKDLDEEYFNNFEKFVKNEKKLLLFADYSILMPDKNAGARASWLYLNNILEFGWKVLFYSDNLLYEEKYSKQTLEKGVFILWGRHRQRRILDALIKCNNISLNFINRPNVAESLEEYLEKSKARFIYFGHDIHFLRLKREYDIKQEEIYKLRYEEYKKLENKYIKKSYVAGYPSMDEVELLTKKYGYGNVVYFPLYSFKKHPFSRDFKKTKNIVFVGGYAHAPNVDGAIWLCKEVLPYLKKFGFKDKIYLVGSNPTDEIWGLANEQIKVTGFVTDKELNEIYINSKLVAIPLRYGAGMKGKLLEALYNDVPIVTTSIGCEGLRNHNNCMEIADDPIEFAKKIMYIYSDDKLAERLALNGHDYINKYFGENTIKNCLIKYLSTEGN